LLRAARRVEGERSGRKEDNKKRRERKEENQKGREKKLVGERRKGVISIFTYNGPSLRKGQTEEGRGSEEWT
jgi:hypothetical protein